MTRGGPSASQLWSEWRRTTRFLESARLAFARERNLWRTLEIDESHAVKLRAPAGQGAYQVSLDDHVEAVSDEEELFSAVLVLAYATTEAAALGRLGVEVSDVGGVEDWGNRVLTQNNRTWSDVMDQKAGLVEVAVVRNAIAHGSRSIDESSARRLEAVGAPARPSGTAVSVNYDEVKLYRDRLRSLLRNSGFN